jgi:hypothetical protein
MMTGSQAPDGGAATGERETCDCFQKRRSQRVHWTPDGGVCLTCGLPMAEAHAGELPQPKAARKPEHGVAGQPGTQVIERT